MLRNFAAAIALSLAALSGANAADANLQDFFGEWVGSGKAQEGSQTTQDRDSTVLIERSADGFKITWNTMRTQLDDQSSSVMKSTTIKFKGTASPKLFHATDNGDPLKGGRLAWAALSGQTLQIRLFAVESDGAWTVQAFDRVLSSPTTMNVDFKRTTNGQIARQVQLKLTKVP
jgi:hypothetical protein